MPVKSAEKKVQDAIAALRNYVKIDHEKAVEALAQRTPKKEDAQQSAEPLVKNQTVNTALTTAGRWWSSSMSFVSNSVDYLHKHVVHTPALTTARQKLVHEYLTKLAELSEPSEQLELIKKLVVDNMALSIEHLAKGCEDRSKISEDILHSGSLHNALLQALELSKEEACQLCHIAEPQAATVAL